MRVRGIDKSMSIECCGQRPSGPPAEPKESDLIALVTSTTLTLAGSGPLCKYFVLCLVFWPYRKSFTILHHGRDPGTLHHIRNRIQRQGVTSKIMSGPNACGIFSTSS